MTTLVNSKSNRTSEIPVQNRSRRRIASTAEATISTFETPFGWMGLLGVANELVSVFVGHSSARSVRSSATAIEASIDEGDWNPLVRNLLDDYAEGEAVDFSSVPIRLPPMTEFRRQIVSATRQLQYGETATYGELARRIGHPGAARAVGTVMSTNRFPILIPCHRVLAAGGKLGGYTSPAGTDLKRRLLHCEGCSLGIDR